MSNRFNISQAGAARFLLLCGLGVGGLITRPAPARPIEFSDPGSSNLTIHVSSLGVKPAALPDVGDRVFKPHNYSSAQGQISSMKPLPPAPGLASRQKSHVPGLGERDQNWLQQRPQEMLQGMMDKEALKLPTYGAGNKPLDSGSTWDPYNLYARRSSTAKAELRGQLRETNRLGASATLNANDPFAALSGRRPSPDYPATLDVNTARPLGVADWLHTGDDSTPDVRRDRLDTANPLDEFRKNQGLPTAVGNSGWLNPPPPARNNNAFVSDVEKSLRRAGGAASLLTLPNLPAAPTAPVAPGQTSLTPAPYSPTVKPKPLDVSAPRRHF